MTPSQWFLAFWIALWLAVGFGGLYAGVKWLRRGTETQTAEETDSREYDVFHR